jgi:hypothetical protein
MKTKLASQRSGPNQRRIMQNANSRRAILNPLKNSIRKTAQIWSSLSAVSFYCSRITFVVLLWHTSASAINLKHETAQAWDEYIGGVNIRIKQCASASNSFLWVDGAPGRGASVRSKHIVVSPGAEHVPIKVPFGLIHHWIAATFMPDVSIADVLRVVRDYSRYEDFYRPGVIDSKSIDINPDKDRFSLVLMNKPFFKKTALDSDDEASYVRVDDHRLYMVSRTTRIREIAEFGAPGAHTLPRDEGTGIIWRLFSVVRFAERDGGLYIEVEAIALSRDIPGALRAVAGPIVRHVSKEALVTALKETEAAVLATRH